MGEFLETYRPSRLNCEETETLSSPATVKDFESFINPPPQRSRVRHLLWWIHQAFQELMPILLKLFQNKTKIKQTNRRGTNTPPLVPWGRDSSDTKARQGRHRRRESWANIPGNRHRNPQNVSKPSSTIHDKGHTPWSNGGRSGDARLFDTRQRGSVIQRVEGMKH